MRQIWCTAILGVVLGMGLIITVLPTLAHACAVCVGSSAEDQGYFWGVLFLMAMPFALGSFIGGWLLYHYRRAQPGLIAPAPTTEGRTPPPASTSPAPERHNDGSQAHYV
jgi:hypothetical protein